MAAPETAQFGADRILDHFADKTVADITPAEIAAYAAARRSLSRKDGTIARELTVLRAALNQAVAEHRIPAAPAITSPAPSPPRERWLTPREAGKLIAKADTPELRMFLMLALHTGARRGAILDLTWFQVDLTNRRIDFNAPGRPQTAKRRPVVPINDVLAVELRGARRKRKSGYVVGWEGYRKGWLRRGFRRALKAARLEGATPHTLRHTAATWMAQRGVPLATIAGILGQSIARTTERYIKHHPDYLREGVEALASVGAQWARNAEGSGGKRRKSAAKNG